MSAIATLSSLHVSVFLRRVLLADAAVSTVCGALMAFGAALLEPLLGIGATLLVPAGLALFPYAAYLVWLARRRAVPRAAVWIPIVLNVVWAADCLLVLFGGRYAPTNSSPSSNTSGCAARTLSLLRECRSAVP